MSTAPDFNIDLSAFRQNPYPALAGMRRQAPIAYVPQLGGTVFTRRDDVAECEKNIEVFSSHQPAGLMNKLMGLNMMRKDGAEHTFERKMLLPTYSQKTVKNHWQSHFQVDVDKRLDAFATGDKVDLLSEFAMPASADALKWLTGLIDSEVEDLDRWSQQMIDGVSNYRGDPAVEQRCLQSTSAIDAAIDAAIEKSAALSTGQNDHSMLGAMLACDLPMESVRANIKLAISGGQNEPRDAIAGTIWALLTHPQQLAMVISGDATWAQAFEEYLRWLSPIGMSPRRVARSFQFRDVEFSPEDKVFFMFSSANRDEEHFAAADQYDITRDSTRHIGFGAGPHFCIAAAASRCLAIDVALPSIFQRFPKLHLDDSSTVKVDGWAFRGIQNLPVIL